MFLSMQYLDDFILSMLHAELDWTKHSRITALKMTSVEWERLKLFVELLEVRQYLVAALNIIINVVCRKLILLSNPFHMRTPPPSTTRFQLSKRYTKRGARVRHVQNSSHSVALSSERLIKLRSIMTKHQRHMPTPLRCVRTFIFLYAEYLY